MQAVVTVMGVDKKGIIAKVSTCLSDNSINILDITQTIMQDIFTMVMMVDMTEAKDEFSSIATQLEKLGSELGLEIKIQHADIFRSMHRI